jgi:hypothetical protein
MSKRIPEDTWEKFLETQQNERRKRVVLQSPRVSVRPRNVDLEECFIEKLEISNLKNEISALKRRNAELIAGPYLIQKKTNLSKILNPTLSNLRQQTNGANADQRYKAYAQDRQEFSDAYKLLHPRGGNNKGNKNKYSKKVNSKKSRRFRKHKRSATRRRSTASRRRYKNRK